MSKEMSEKMRWIGGSSCRDYKYINIVNLIF